MTTLIWTITAIPYRSITIIKACELDQPIKALPIITAGSARCVISEKLMTIIWSCVGLCLQEPGQTAAIIGILVTRHPWFKMASCQAENPFVQGSWPRRERVKVVIFKLTSSNVLSTQCLPYDQGKVSLLV